MIEKKQNTLKIDDIISRLWKSNLQIRSPFPLSESEVAGLCQGFKSVTITQPMLLELDPPVFICGDIHGQFPDLIEIFEKLGDPSERNYLFLGDYVDRGKKSLQCICLLMAYKIKCPMTFFLLRGNHQSCKLNKIYGFYDECKRKFNAKLFKTITQAFNYLPVAAVVGQRIFCVHGGISPLLKDLSMLNSIKRPLEIEENKVVCDLLWSDPNTVNQGWQNNFERGVSVTYGRAVLQKFLIQNDLDLICRSHQVVEEGYEFLHDRKLLTIFSAPNYCGEFQNFAAVVCVTGQMVASLQQFRGHLKKTNRIYRSATPLKMVEKDEAFDKRVNDAVQKFDRMPRVRRHTKYVTSVNPTINNQEFSLAVEMSKVSLTQKSE